MRSRSFGSSHYSLPIVGLGVLLFAAPSPVRAQHTIGLYFPSLPVSRAERVRAVSELANSLSKISGVKLRGVSVSKAGNLQKAIKLGRVHFVIAPASYAAERRLKALAVLSRGGATSVQWKVVTRSGATSLAQLKGKRLAMAQVGNAWKKFAVNVLFEGEVGAKYFKFVKTPDSASALIAVGGKADAAVVPAVTPSKMATVFTSRRVPLPVFAAGAKVPAATLQKVVKAVVTLGGNWLGFRWRVAKGVALASLRRQMDAGAPPKRPIAIKPEGFGKLQRTVLRNYAPSAAFPSSLWVVRVPSIRPDDEG